MTAALAWKEYREHRGVWLTMAAVGGLAMPAVARLVSGGVLGFSGGRESVLSVACLMAWAYGLVCGAMLLAGEREDGTLEFLDGLPRLRRQLWTAKCLIGVGLVLAQTAVLTVYAAGLGAVEPDPQTALAAVAFAYCGLTGLGWGLLFSASGSNVLGVIGKAIGAQIVSNILLVCLLFLVMVAAGPLRHGPADLHVLVLGLGNLGLTVLAYAGSRRTFCRTDRLRRPGARAEERPAGWAGLLWLSWQQARSFARVLAPCSVAAGLVVMAGGMAPWAGATLLVGVLCGVTVFADEQAGGAYRFLGDQRLPPGRVWLAKTGVRLAVAAVCALLVVAPSVVRSLLFTTEEGSFQQRPWTFLAWLFHDPVLGTVAPPGAFLLLWLLHGFAVGQLCSLLVRKSLVAAVLALMASGVAVSVWLPSLAGGGLHLWQAAGVPVLTLVASRLLLPAWTAGRLTGATVAGGVAATAAASVVWVAGALAYRVAEIPDTEDVLDLPGFLAELPSAEQNEAGRLTQNALDNLSGRLRELRHEQPSKPLFPREKADPNHPNFPHQAAGAPGQGRPGTRPPGEAPEDFLKQGADVLEHGWPGGEPELAGWLDRVFAASWPGDLARAAGLPPGVVEDPRRMTVDSAMPKLDNARRAAVLLAVHGVRRQARGDDAAFVADLRSGLALSRNLRNHSVLLPVFTARAAEGLLLDGIDRWLERLQGRPDLLREVRALLLRHEELLPDDPLDVQRAELLMVENTLEHPEGLLTDALRNGPYPVNPAAVAAVAVAWQVPWERERQRRMVRLLFRDKRPSRTRVFDAAPWIWSLGVGTSISEESDRQRQELVQLRARQLEVALRLYQAEKGRPAAALDALVPEYLPKVPRDPFDFRPFRYRLSAGERVEWPEGGGMPGKTRQLPAGQGVLWSVGKDGADDGGRRSGQTRQPEPGTDLIFLVPLPPKPPRQ
jgi:hypothetical protein